jgi:hypothetical protein
MGGLVYGGSGGATCLGKTNTYGQETMGEKTVRSSSSTSVVPTGSSSKRATPSARTHRPHTLTLVLVD